MENEMAILDPLSCIGCGICVPACPIKGIEMRNYKRIQLQSQIEGILKEGPAPVIFIDPVSYSSADIAGISRLKYTPAVRFVGVPSIHILDPEMIEFTFEKGAESIVLVEGTTNPRLTSRSRDLLKSLKKVATKFKKTMRYSHIEVYQYEKLTQTLDMCDRA
jgi:heterodisulfide reductase subunit A